MNSDCNTENRFCRRWERWHRLGWLPYLACSLIGSGVLTAAAIYIVRNLLDHGFTFSAWHGLTRADYFILVGVVFASVTSLLGRFSANEARYERLSSSNRNA